MIVTAITPIEVEVLSEGSYRPGEKQTWDCPGSGPEVETHEISSLFVDVRHIVAGKIVSDRVDILAGIDRKSHVWLAIEKNILDAIGDTIAEDLARAGDDWEDEPYRWEA